MCRYALDGRWGGPKLPGQAGRHPHLTVTVDHDRLRRGLAAAGHLDLYRSPSGDPLPLTAGQVRALGCDAGLIPALLGSQSLPLDVGRANRFATPAQRTALALRDGGCAMPGCTAHPDACIAHHLTHWGEPTKGRTDLHNLSLLCPAHHTQVHKQGWTVRIGPDTIVELTPPAWLDPDRTPRHHERHTARRLGGRR